VGRAVVAVIATLEPLSARRQSVTRIVGRLVRGLALPGIAVLAAS